MNKRAITVRPVIRTFIRYVRHHPLLLFLSLFFSALVHVLKIIVPLFYKRFFDVLASTTPAFMDDAVETLIGILFIIVGIGALGWVFRRISQFSSNYFQSRTMADITNGSFGYLFGHSHGFFINNFAGSLVRRVNRLVRAFEQVVDNTLWNIIPLAVTVIGILIVLFSRHVLLGSALLIWVTVFIGLHFFIARWKQKYNIERAAKDSEATGVLSDSITNQTNVKLFSGRTHEQHLFGNVIEELRRLRLLTWNIDEIINMAQGVLMILLEFALMFIAIKFWREGVLTVGDFALIQAYIITVFGHMWNIGGVIRRLYEAFADATEMVEILDAPHEISDKTGAPDLLVTKGAVEFNNISFYFRGTRSIFKDFSLSIAGGTKAALVGPSGAGKTTITQLLLRLYDVSSGHILIDGQDISLVTQESLRDSISFVPQDSVLFHRTLMDNIRYGKRTATDEEVIEAAKQAHCHEFISQFPEGYKTFVGERGVKLSGGERQRVAIARAILKNAPILILDEATSSLDSESEKYIQDALQTLMKGKTVIVVAHRLSTIMLMDTIIVLEKGRVVTEGTHEQLRSTEGLYKKLWDIQAGGFLGRST